MEDMVLISLDDHIIEPPTMYDQHLTLEQKGSAPSFHTDELGRDYWLYDGKRCGNLGLNAVVGRPKREYGFEPLALNQMRKGCYNLAARLDDMNVNGVLASLCYPTIVRFSGSVFSDYRDKKQALTHLRAYNDWYIDEWCGSARGRFIPLALAPTWDMVATVEEVRRVAKKGCHSVNMSDNPTTTGLPSFHNDYWEPFWKVCAEHDMVVSMHHGSGNAAQHASMESPIDAWITCMPMSISIALADLLHLKALQKYANLKIALIESGIGWIPFVIERADFVLQQHGQWTHADFGKGSPSQVFKDHFLCTFVDDRAGLDLIDRLGANTICFETDYPHSDTQWPHSPEVLYTSLGKLTDEQIDLITHRNVMRDFKFDAYKLMGGRENCTVGALRAQAKHVDTSEISQAGHDPAEGAARTRVTSEQIMKLFEAPASEASDEKRHAPPGFTKHNAPDAALKEPA